MKVLFVKAERFALLSFYRFVKNSQEELESNLQFVIDEGQYMAKDYFNTSFSKFYGETPAVCKVSTTITNKVDSDLEQHFNLINALAVLDKAAQLQCPDL